MTASPRAVPGSLGRIDRLVVTPAVVAHRGASGHRPEHTLAAYRTAIAMGADDLEIDLVPTRDGVLVARHEHELSRTTDVARRPELAHLQTTKVVGGRAVSGWFTEDLTLAQVKTLTARERWPGLRPRNTEHDGREGVPTLTEVLAMLQAESVRHGRTVGLMLELKDAAYFDSLGLPLDRLLMAELAHVGLDRPRSRVSLMSFEPTVLERLAGSSCRLPLVQLVGKPDQRPDDLAAAGDPRTFRDLVSPGGLDRIATYADGLGAWRGLLLAPRTLRPEPLVRDAHERWLTVHVWTLRAENAHLPNVLTRGLDRAAHGDLATYARAFLDAGVDGIITDHPDQVWPLVAAPAA